MKRKFLLSLAIAFGVAGSVWADLTKVDGVYQIGSAQDLVELATLVNSGEEMTANAVLTEDIDMSTVSSEWIAIGDWGEISGTASAGYKGHFDGQGHIITGFNTTSSHNYYGIFGVIEGGAIVENFTIYGTMDLGHKTGGVVAYARDATIRNIQSYLTINCTEAATTALRPGGILGSAVNGTTVVEKCTYSGTLNVGEHTGNIGGIVGYVNNNASAIVNITNCLFDGKIENGTADGQCGGVVGYSNKGKVTIKNCLSIGTITTGAGNDGMFFGRLNTSNSKFDGKNYYVGTNVNGTSSGASATGTAPTVTTTELLASGEVAYALNDEKSDEVSWFQKLGTDEYPTPYGTDIIYPAGRQHCDGTAYEGVTGFSNAASVQDDHDFVDGYCSYCGAIDADYMTPNVEGFLEISTPNQLKWFADYVNQIDPAANAVLTADIDLDGVAWASIGNAEVAYTGTFDGNNKKITGFNYTSKGNGGLFGKTSAAIIKNFSIDGELNIEEGKYAGVIAQAMKSTITNIHSSLTITVANGSHMGGVVGSTEGDSGTTISNCSFSGSITFTANINGSVAGVVGYMSADKVINCANYGDVSFIATNCNAGGIVAYINSTAAYVEHCLNTGKLTCSGGTPIYGAAIVGRIKNNFTPSQLSDNYWLEGSALAAAKKDNTEGDVLPDTKKVTAEQLASGEVAYKLGDAWGQVLGTDEVPSPTSDSSKPSVYEIAIGSTGYASFVPKANIAAIPDGVTAYAGQKNENWLHLEPVTELPANTAVIVKAAAGNYYCNSTTESRSLGTSNDLTFSEIGLVSTGAQYCLANKTSGIGFYKVQSGVTIPARKAYLEVAAGVKAFYLFGEENETAIKSLTPALSEGEGAIYNLAGQRISKLQKGFNIVNGKKVLF